MGLRRERTRTCGGGVALEGRAFVGIQRTRGAELAAKRFDTSRSSGGGIWRVSHYFLSLLSMSPFSYPTLFLDPGELCDAMRNEKEKKKRASVCARTRVKGEFASFARSGWRRCVCNDVRAVVCL